MICLEGEVRELGGVLELLEVRGGSRLRGISSGVGRRTQNGSEGVGSRVFDEENEKAL